MCIAALQCVFRGICSACTDGPLRLHEEGTALNLEGLWVQMEELPLEVYISSNSIQLVSRIVPHGTRQHLIDTYSVLRLSLPNLCRSL